MNTSAVVWVAYATQAQQFNIAVPFQEGLTAQQAIEQSGIAQQVTLPDPLQLGIWGVRLTDHHKVLEVGDRVEIYRALTINPLDIRRKRAEKNPVGRFGKSNRAKNLQGRSHKPD
ncbi:RnfH family protein [Acinetobacter sp. NCu2D-2]|uniref:RnfH family protein n=1 Tax=Acinetobacter sp. NCu2D-2 TaxID=1608473 RepID=UPI0007CDC758|nr:RnfH family protein [Acinetobacter sp. NCu2D-2]ANF81213.1 RnfH family protein [Acinetobacter sp. NCu2D-2]